MAPTIEKAKIIHATLIHASCRSPSFLMVGTSFSIVMKDKHGRMKAITNAMLEPMKLRGEEFW